MEMEEVIEYIIPLLEGKATPEQAQKVGCWLEESEENRCKYRAIVELYYKLNYAESWNKIDVDKAVRRIRKHISLKNRTIARMYYLSGMVALLAICFGVHLFLQTGKKTAYTPLAVVEEVKSGEMRATLTLANGEKVGLNSGNKVNVDLGFARAVEDSLNGLIYRFKDSVTAPRDFHTLTVPRAGEYIMVLSDGSRVWLNSETEIKYPVNFDKDKREVFLTGEAYFEITRDTRRPFIVVTPQTRTMVLGTSFNVMAYKGESHTEITLVSGAVSVMAGKQQCQIAPGQQVAVNNGSLEMNSRHVNHLFYTSWKDGLFDFDGMTLSELCVKLGRWYDVDFFFVNQAAAEKQFTGAVKRNGSLQFVLDFIKKTSGVYFQIRGKTVMVYDN